MSAPQTAEETIALLHASIAKVARERGAKLRVVTPEVMRARAKLREDELCAEPTSCGSCGSFMECECAGVAT